MAYSVLAEFEQRARAVFADPMMQRMSEVKAGLSPGSDSAKIRTKDAERRELPESVSDEIDRLWAERIVPVTGHTDYARLISALERA